MITFWILAPVIVLAALGLIFVHKAVHAALCLAVVMICLAVVYASLDAPFLFAVQIVVYTGAIMMLFLFVLMLVGIDADDTVALGAEDGPQLRVAGALIGALFAGVAVTAVAQAVTGAVVGLDQANADGNPIGLARLLFGKYVLAFEFTSALLITAVLGAMVLAHRERLGQRLTQADFAARRMADYARTGRNPVGPPSPGVYARHNSVDTPGLLPDGTPLEASMPESLHHVGPHTSGAGKLQAGDDA